MKTQFKLILFPLLLVFSVFAYQEIEIYPDLKSYPLKKGGLGSSSQIQLYNYHNFQYYADIYVGTKPQKFSVVLDTGSHLLWVPASNCTKCRFKSNKFNFGKSKTYQSYHQKSQIQYGRGYVSGSLGADTVNFQGISINQNILFADYENDTQSMNADGIMGLSNWKNQSNIFDIAYQQFKLVSSVFGFKLGIQQLRQKSFFYYNISNDDFNTASFVNTTRPYYWTIPVREMLINQQAYDIQEALIDTGTSLIVFPASIYHRMDQQFLSKYCLHDNDYGMRQCLCPNQAPYPNITIMSEGISFDIMPSDYLLGGVLSKRCFLGIDKLDIINFTILGDVFLQQHFVLFDKEKSRIGFINNHRHLATYIQEKFFVWFFYYMAFAVMIAAFGAIFLKAKPKYLKQSLIKSSQGYYFQLGKS